MTGITAPYEIGQFIDGEWTGAATSPRHRPTSGLDLNVPFGGIKESSSNTYREQGLGALEFFSWTKTVYLGYGPA
jgi:hypothetical protein